MTTESALEDRRHSMEGLLAWVDLETTGLRKRGEDSILEIAVIVTDGQLREQWYGPNLVLRSTEGELSQMPENVQEMHKHSGLWADCLESRLGVEEAESEVLAFLKQFAEPGQVQLAGSTVNFDREFMETWMPDLAAWFHYRSMDVSSFKEAFKRWIPQLVEEMPKDQNAHRALADIEESIRALDFFRVRVMNLFRGGDGIISVPKF